MYIYNTVKGQKLLQEFICVWEERDGLTVHSINSVDFTELLIFIQKHIYNLSITAVQPRWSRLYVFSRFRRKWKHLAGIYCSEHTLTHPVLWPNHLQYPLLPWACRYNRQRKGVKKHDNPSLGMLVFPAEEFVKGLENLLGDFSPAYWISDQFSWFTFQEPENNVGHTNLLLLHISFVSRGFMSTTVI